MNFDLSEEQSMLVDSVTRLLKDNYNFEARKSYIASQDGWGRRPWLKYAEMGLLALPFPEDIGGVDGTPVETMLVMEAFGRALILEPYLATVVLCGNMLRLGGSAEQQSALIPGIVSGDLQIAFAQAEKQSRYELSDVATTANGNGEGWVIKGLKCHVIHGDCAGKLIVSARLNGDRTDTNGIGLFIVDGEAAGVQRRGYLTQDRQRAAEIRFDNVRVGVDAAIGTPGTAMPLVVHAVDLAIAALCAEAVGVMEKAHEITIDYLKTRHQFGRPIGSFQTLQHRAVDMLVKIEEARSMAMYAAMMCDEPDPATRGRAISAAKVQIGRSGRYVGEQAIQLHGGIGITEEYPIGHYYRRLTVIDLLFGDTQHHLAKLARME